MGLPIARDVLSTLREFRAAQEERVQKYNAFNEGFAAYLIHRQEGPYRSVHHHPGHATASCACMPADSCNRQSRSHRDSRSAVHMCDARL
jgi:hypothetical protein